jgi:predicted RNase H-like nuclease (RuvC/YqgF family)
MRHSESEQLVKNWQMRHTELEQCLNERTGKDSELNGEVRRLSHELEAADSERSSLMAEVRRLKRKDILGAGGQCEVCKAKAAPQQLGASERPRAMDLSDIIRETEKLNASNKKIEFLICQHEAATQHSIESRLSAHATFSNISQS